ncbi:hypothetical protein VCV18_010843 [Metarhizium anisopliae]
MKFTTAILITSSFGIVASWFTCQNHVLFKGINGPNDKCIIGNTCSNSGGRWTRLDSMSVSMGNGNEDVGVW